MSELIGQGITTVKDLIVYLTSKSSSKNIVKNALLREIRDNLKLLSHRDRENLDLKQLISLLSTKAISDAYQANFSFAKISKEKKISGEMLVISKQKKYLGWELERLINSIEGKINDIKHIVLIYPDLKNAPVNLNLRLENLYAQLLLVSIMIYGSQKK